MKKKYGIKLFFVFMTTATGLGAYVKEEPYLFDMLAKKPIVVFEKRKDNTASKVMVADGFVAFNERVVEKSNELPVVLKIYDTRSKYSGLVSELFQEVADKLPPSIICSALDVNAFNDEELKKENGIILNQKLTEAYNLQSSSPVMQINLPAFVFFMQGKPRIIHLKKSETSPEFNQDELYKAILSLMP